MEFKHVPIMLDECIENLDIKPNGIYVDGTLGGAGHSAHIASKLSHEGLLIGIDQDSNAIEAAGNRLNAVDGKGKIILKRTNFRNIKNVLLQMNIEAVNGVLLDLGVSSHQLDEGERGFSYNKNARLDMRMSDENSLDAEYVVNHYTKDEIAKVIKEYGEEKWALRIADFIVQEREKYRIETTWQLVDIIKMAVPSGARREGPHPAKRTFQAIRIEVNQELNVLKEALKDIVEMLCVGGRICVITFHSLEDRIVKDFFNKKAKPCECPSHFPICVCGKKPELKTITRKPIVPSEDELVKNSRARSAKLRVAEKI